MPGFLCARRRFGASGADEVIELPMGAVAGAATAAGLAWVLSPWAVAQVPLLDASTYMDHGPSSSASSATQIH